MGADAPGEIPADGASYPALLCRVKLSWPIGPGGSGSTKHSFGRQCEAGAADQMRTLRSCWPIRALESAYRFQSAYARRRERLAVCVSSHVSDRVEKRMYAASFHLAAAGSPAAGQNATGQTMTDDLVMLCPQGNIEKETNDVLTVWRDRLPIGERTRGYTDKDLGLPIHAAALLRVVVPLEHSRAHHSAALLWTTA
jgi:hypothetical protein